MPKLSLFLSPITSPLKPPTITLLAVLMALIALPSCSESNPEPPDIVLTPALQLHAELNNAPNVPPGSSIYTTEVGLRWHIIDDTFDNLTASDFASIEKQYQRYVAENARTPSGMPKIIFMHIAFQNSRLVTEKGIKPEIETKIKEWLSAYPESPIAHIAYTRLLYQTAWKQRGGAYAHDVLKNQFDAMQRTMVKARDHTYENAEFMRNDPQFYALLIEMAFLGFMSEEDRNQIVDEAFNRFPEDTMIYSAIAGYMQPKWGYSTEHLLYFADYATLQTPELKQSAYARFVWAASVTNEFTYEMVKNGSFEWKRLKTAFWDLLELYPESRNAIELLKLSCLVNDKDTAMKVHDLLADIKGLDIFDDERLAPCVENGYSQFFKKPATSNFEISNR